MFVTQMSSSPRIDRQIPNAARMMKMKFIFIFLQCLLNDSFMRDFIMRVVSEGTARRVSFFMFDRPLFFVKDNSTHSDFFIINCFLINQIHV